MPGPTAARPAHALKAIRLAGIACHTMLQCGARGMICGRSVDFTPIEIASHKRHDSATWPTWTNSKSYTRSFALEASLDRRFGLPSILAASPASTPTAGASCSAGVLP